MLVDRSYFFLYFAGYALFLIVLFCFLMFILFVCLFFDGKFMSQKCVSYFDFWPAPYMKVVFLSFSKCHLRPSCIHMTFSISIDLYRRKTTFVGKVHPEPKFSTFCGLSQNHQLCFWKAIHQPFCLIDLVAVTCLFSRKSTLNFVVDCLAYTTFILIFSAFNFQTNSAMKRYNLQLFPFLSRLNLVQEET